MTLPARPADRFPGAPLIPTGNPMVEGVGPAAYAMRADTPDLTVHGKAKIVPLGQAPTFYLEPRDPDPRGMAVMGADDKVAGMVSEVWVDLSEPQVRYLQMTLPDGSEGVLLPIGYAKVDMRRRLIRVRAILADQFSAVPRTKDRFRITRLEEDRIQAYFAGGYLYAEPSRLGPLL